MKKFIVKILTLSLIFILVLSGCTTSTESTNGAKPKEQKEQVHNYVLTETNDYLVKDGKSDYTVIFPSENVKKHTSLAVSEFLEFFKQATGILLKSSSDVGLTFDQSKTYISIGDTTIKEQAGLSYDVKELGTSGTQIKTVGKSVFIMGDAYGEVNGVYAFMKAYFDYHAYSGDEIYVKTGVTNQKFYTLDIKDIPDIEHVLNPYAGNGNTNFRMHLKTVGDVYAGNRGYVWHNIMDGIVPFELYGVDPTKDVDVNGNTITQNMKDAIVKHPMYTQKPEWFNHPEWYVMEKYAAQDPLGDRNLIEPLQVNITVSVDGWSKEQNEQSQALLYEVMLYEMKLVLEDTATREMAFTAEDNQYWSDDAISTANKEKYGTDAAEYIHCANYLATQLKKEYPTFRLTIFAYSGLKIAPTKLNENGEYVPVDDSVILADNVDVMICYSGQSRTTEFMDETQNANCIELEKSWMPIVGRYTTWVYGLTYYQNYFMPTPTIMGLADNYRHFFENGYRLVFDEAQVGKFVSTDWAVLKTYIVSQVGWDCYQDVSTLTQNFFDNYFKVASKPMKEAFDMEQNRMVQLGFEIGDLSNIMGNSDTSIKAMAQESSWPDNLLQQILAKFDEAFDAIEIYKTSNPALYETLYNRILLETLSLRWLRAEIYGKYYGDLKSEWMTSIYNDAKSLGMTHFGGQTSLDYYFTNK